MGLSVDLNADMGESFGAWTMGDDETLLGIVTSANIACGFHAGDPDVMSRTMALAVRNNVGMGAHPGFPDLQGFGRRRMHLATETLQNMVRYQLGAAQGMARAAGGDLRHFKLHGALSNMACDAPELAHACYSAAREVAPGITLMVLAATGMEQAAKDLGGPYAAEIFADRAYNDDASLVDRSQKGAVIHDADLAASRMVEMVRAGAIITASGKRVPTRIDTICLHGDTAEAVQIAARTRQKLTEAGIAVTRF